MNLKLIDAAIAVGAKDIDPALRAQLDYWRQVWGVQDAVCREVDQVAREVIPSEEVARMVGTGKPVLTEHPMTMEGATFLDGLRKVSAVLLEQGGFLPLVHEGFQKADWSAVTTPDLMGLAGTDPGAFFDEVLGVFHEQGLDDTQAYMCMTVCVLVERAMLQGYAGEICDALRRVPEGSVPHPCDCPVCGSPATLARVGRTTSVPQGRGRELWCSVCGATWDFERIRCARCGTRDQAKLHMRSIEGDDMHRVAVCDECGGQLRSVFQDEMGLHPFSFEVEDILMIPLDMAMQSAE